MDTSRTRGNYPVGQQMIQIPHHHSGNGTENIASIACSTPAFSFAETTPELPVTLPNTSTIEA